ncbi:MAG: class I SAM-dependent methyltransferase [Candidatus Symbiothrix sp.]|jgi:precorrin-6B methylase 2|nr:class I SAM-dependent methyltransferase [Candidatus Symbiothrix sp.]
MNEATKKFIIAHRFDDVQKLALQSQSFAEIDIPAALTQISGRQIIEHKIPSWYPSDEIRYPGRLPLEQCSSEKTARYKASLLSGDSFVDLTGGLGVDTAFISPNFSRVTYVEKQAELAKLAKHNFSVLELNSIQIESGDGTEFLEQMDPVDCIYLDPARRSLSGKKTVLIEDCEPNLLEIQDLLLKKAGTVLIKLSPLLDINAALRVLKNVREVHVVSVENECKELLFLLKKGDTPAPLITCVNLRKKEDQTLSFEYPEEKKAQMAYTPEIKDFLYEPNASLLKAGFYKGLALRYKVEKLHPDSHLYTSTHCVPDFPGRIFRVEAVSSLNKKDLKAFLTGLDKANLTIRNFPLTVADLRKKLKLKEGGDVYLFGTTLSNGVHVLVKTYPIYGIFETLPKKNAAS